jgi:hypothetical protein
MPKISKVMLDALSELIYAGDTFTPYTSAEYHTCRKLHDLKLLDNNRGSYCLNDRGLEALIAAGVA